MATPSTEFDWHKALQQADRILAAPPARSFIQRPTLLGNVIFRAALPSGVCVAANAASRRAYVMNPWAISAIKSKLWTQMETQSIPWLRYRWAWPVEGSPRPQVVAVKFSSQAPDVGSNPGKAAIDMLTCHRLLDRKKQRYTEHRLGIIRDDRPACVEQIHRWEFLPKAEAAFLLLEVRV